MIAVFIGACYLACVIVPIIWVLNTGYDPDIDRRNVAQPLNRRIK